MRVKDVFRLDLAREIKEVIKVDDVDRIDVANEITEYVVTDHIHAAFADLLDQYQESIRKPTEMVNIWVSGFFGSGKSSFAKIFGHALANTDLGELTAADLLTRKLATTQISALLRTIHAHAPTMVVFVDLSSSRNVAREGESVVLPLYRQLLSDLNYPRDLTLAELEIDLEEKGELLAFEQAFSEANGYEWHTRRDKALALNEASKALHVLAPDTYPSADSYARTKPQPEITANLFANRALQLLKRRRPELKRIAFVLDEAGQYVSRSVQRMLDLQGFAQACQKKDGRLWLIATGQETLEDVVGALGDKRVELARVRDRFPLTVDLIPSDIEEVVSKRVLDKNEQGSVLVRATYERHKNQLLANVSIDSPKRSSDVSADEFVRFYPLLPYQIPLFIDAVSARRAHGGAGPMVGGANRTLIRLAHQLVRTSMSERPIGDIATVSMAYDLMDAMIPTTWRSEIEQTGQRHGKESTALAVTKAIALISGVSALKLNAHNLSVLIHPSVQAESREADVSAALEALVREETIRDGESGYRLQSPQEKDWEKLRRGRELKTGDFNRLLREKRLPEIFRGLTASAGREFSIQIYFDDDKLMDGDVVLRIYEGGPSQLERAVRRSRESAHENEIFFVFERSEDTWTQAEEVFRSQEIIKSAENRSLEAAEKDLLHEERKRSEGLIRRLDRLLQRDLGKGTLLFRGNETALEGRDLRPALSKALGRYVDTIYPRLVEFAAPLRRGDAYALLKSDNLAGLDHLASQGLRLITIDSEGYKIDETGPVADFVKAVRERVDRMGSEPTGKWLEAHFHAPPFGADSDSVRAIAAAAVRAGLVRVAYEGISLSGREDARLEKVFSGVREFRSALFRTREELDVGVRIRVAKLLHHDLVGEKPGLSTEELSSFARRHLTPIRETILELSAALSATGLRVPASIIQASQLLHRMRMEDDEDLVRSLDSGRNDLKDGVTAARRLKELVDDPARLEVLRQAAKALDGDDRGLSEKGRDALSRGQEVLRTAAYTERFPELRIFVEAVEAERESAWREALQELQEALGHVRDQAAPLLEQVGEAAREEFAARLSNSDVSQEDLDRRQPSRDVLIARTAQLPRALDDLRAEVGRGQGFEVRRVPVRELFPEPVRDEDGLEALIERIRRAGEDALKDGAYFLLI